MRKPRLLPSFEHYLSDLGQEELLATVLKGHLVIEALLVELLQLKFSGNKPWRWDFPTKIKRCIEAGFIDAAKGDALLALNNLRNDFGHILGHQITFDDAFSIAHALGSSGFDFSDDTLWTDKGLSEEWYGIDGIIIEILNSYYFELASILHDQGGANRLGG